MFPKRCRSYGVSNMKVWTVSGPRRSSSASRTNLEEFVSKVVYRSEVRIERVKGPVRTAYLPAESDPAIFGVQRAVAEHSSLSPNIAEPHPTTPDYILAASAL